LFFKADLLQVRLFLAKCQNLSEWNS